MQTALVALQLAHVRGRQCSRELVTRTAGAAAAIWSAFEQLWQAGVLHGDVAGRNVLWSPAGHATIIDLGLARRRADVDKRDFAAEVADVARLCGCERPAT